MTDEPSFGTDRKSFGKGWSGWSVLRVAATTGCVAVFGPWHPTGRVRCRQSSLWTAELTRLFRVLWDTAQSESRGTTLWGEVNRCNSKLRVEATSFIAALCRRPEWNGTISWRGDNGQLCGEPLRGNVAGTTSSAIHGVPRLRGSSRAEETAVQTPGRSSDPSSRGATGFDTQTKPEKTEQYGAPSGAPSFVQTGDRRGSTSSAQQLEFLSRSDGRCTEWDFRGLARGRFE